MEKTEELKDRLYRFALEVVRLVRSVPREVAGVEIGRQLIRSGTSVAANYEEAAPAFSKSDFIYKLSTSFKESKETNLWIRLLRDSGLISSKTAEPLVKESYEIASILAKSLKTARKNLESGV